MVAPVAVGVAAMNWGDYMGGVYPKELCDGDIDHAVLLVGWGDDAGLEVGPYWKIKTAGKFQHAGEARATAPSAMTSRFGALAGRMMRNRRWSARALSSTPKRTSRNAEAGLPAFVVPTAVLAGSSGVAYYLYSLDTLPWPLSAIADSVQEAVAPEVDKLLDSKMKGMPKRTLLVGFDGTIVTKTWSRRCVARACVQCARARARRPLQRALVPRAPPPTHTHHHHRPICAFAHRISLPCSAVPRLSAFRRYGWRTVKRPGLDSFLLQLQQYYEVVLFSNESATIAEPTVARLDKFNLFHRKLYRDSTTRVNGKLVKDLERLNRDLSDVIIIDSDPQAFSCQRRNGIAIEPFKDPENSSDNALLGLLPMLIAISLEPQSDTRDLLATFAGRKCDDGAIGESAQEGAPPATEESVVPYAAAELVRAHASMAQHRQRGAKQGGLRGVLAKTGALTAGTVEEAPMMLPANAPAVPNDELSPTQILAAAKAALTGDAEAAAAAAAASMPPPRQRKAKIQRAPTYWEKVYREEQVAREAEEKKMMAAQGMQ
jgi:Dullard-like phosphatase family protein